MKNVWFQKGSDFHVGEIPGEFHDILPLGVYKTQQDPKTGEIYTTRVSDKFEFDYKIYGLEDAFIKRVIKTYKNLKGNIGILLNGVRGTGKTVTSEMIANLLEQPVIILTQNYKGLADFINSIPNDVTFFFDEYEKIFKGTTDDDDVYETRDDVLLSVMDGALNNEYRKVFLLTTNNKWVNENLLQRPGRIRYSKTFKDLPKDTILEIINDKLGKTEFLDECVEFISGLELITVDIVKAIIDEVNIHNEGPLAFEKDFNVQRIQNQFNLSIFNEGRWEMLHEDITINPGDMRRNNTIYVEDEPICKITKRYQDGTFDGHSYIILDEQSKMTPQKYKLEEYRSKHTAFHSDAF